MTQSIRTRTGRIATVSLLIAFGSALLVSHALAEETSPIEPNEFLSLKSDIRVASEFVTLGDLFHMQGEQSGINVVRAPKPGAKLAIPASALARFVWKQGLRWDNAMQLRQVMIRRTSTEIRSEEIREALELAFLDTGIDDTIDIRLQSPNLVIHLPANMAPELSVEALNHDSTSGRFTAEIRTPLDNGETQLTQLVGQTIQIQTIPVLAHPVRRGEILTAADFRIERIPVKRMGTNIVTDTSDVIGMQTKRALRVGQPFRTSDLTAPILVKKGALVTMTFDAPGIKLTNLGKALEAGSDGDLINVINPRSRQTVMACITAANQVSVSTFSMQIASAQ